VSTRLKLIVGLGNPGSEHIQTRHNAGFWFLDSLAERLSLNFVLDKKFQSEICRYQNDNFDCLLCKPQTYMNDSGKAVQALIKFYKIPVNKILIVHDEIDLDVGNLRFKIGGGHGGNNGVRDIIEKVGDTNFSRLRIGIGHPGSVDKVVSYVLNKPNNDDTENILIGINIIIDEYQNLFQGKIEELMNQNNKRNKKD
jgi:PTH1 family peptidyl-tRNA hydrolase